MKTKKGFALIFSLLISMIILITIIGLTSITVGDISLMSKTTDGIRAYYLAETGLVKKFLLLRAATGNETQGTNGSITLSAGNSGTFEVTVQQLSAGVFPTYKLISVGTYKNATKTLTLIVRSISYSRYIYLTDTELRGGTTPIWFIQGDTIRGPLHTNGQLNISENPVFEGPVSSVSNSIKYYHGSSPPDNPDFRESLTLSAPNITLPTNTDILASLKTSSQQSNGLYFKGDSTVTLLSNGTMNITNDGSKQTGVANAGKKWTNHNVPVPQSGAFFVDNGNLNLSGILSGQLTVGNQGSGKEIYITNNILYANDPRTNPSSTDLLGIVSSNDVIVDDNAPYNLEIDGYILALNKSFYVEDYTTGLKGTLTLYGGVTQDERGAVGTFNSGTGNRSSGYLKDYNYDQRLADNAPAFFPPAKDSSGRIVYSKVLWAEL